MKIIFVDGYNVINSWPNLKEEKDASFDGARKKLIDTMHNYGTYEHCKIKIVFDAYLVKGNLQKVEDVNENVSVIFTKDGETADAYIEREIHNLGRRVEIYIVTSDMLEQQTAFQRGAVRMSSLEFYNEIQKVERKISKNTKLNLTVNRNNLSDNIDSDVLKKLEEIRRSDK